MMISKTGAMHKLIIPSAQDGHVGRYAFEVEGIKTEASLFVGGKEISVRDRKLID